MARIATAEIRSLVQRTNQGHVQWSVDGRRHRTAGYLLAMRAHAGPMLFRTDAAGLETDPVRVRLGWSPRARAVRALADAIVDQVIAARSSTTTAVGAVDTPDLSDEGPEVIDLDADRDADLETETDADRAAATEAGGLDHAAGRDGDPGPGIELRTPDSLETGLAPVTPITARPAPSLRLPSVRSAPSAIDRASGRASASRRRS